MGTVEIILSIIIIAICIYLFVRERQVKAEFRKSNERQDNNKLDLHKQAIKIEEDFQQYKVSNEEIVHQILVKIDEDNQKQDQSFQHHISDFESKQSVIEQKQSELDNTIEINKDAQTLALNQHVQENFESYQELLKRISDVLEAMNLLNEKQSNALDEHVQEYNQSNLEVQKNLDDIISTYKRTTETQNTQLTEVVNLLLKKIDGLAEENQKFKKDLEQFTKIGEDSTRLNETVDLEAENQLIQEILQRNQAIKIEPYSAKPDKNDKSTTDSIIFEKNQIPTSGVTEHQNETLVNGVNIREKTPIESLVEAIEGAEEHKENISKSGVEVPKTTEIQSSLLDVKQAAAYNYMENSKENIFISGNAGTGKSFLLRLFSAGTKKKYLKVAPTGISALNIGGVTIHSAFGFQNLMFDNDPKVVKLKSGNREVLKNIDTLIIDEISMVNAETLDRIDSILRQINNTSSLFGGKQLIILGDLFQLPPVVSKDEVKYLNNKYGGIHFFLSKAYQEGNFKYVELNHNHRQNEDQAFFDILSHIRDGSVTDQDIVNLNKRYVSTKDLRRILKLLPRKDQVEKINTDELNLIKAKEYQFEAKITYQSNNQNINIESNFPISSLLKLKLGALILMVRNDEDKRWVNGTLGIISYIDTSNIRVKINNIEYEVKKEVFEMKEAKYENGVIKYDTTIMVEQYPLILAYAMTIHKSQGQTYKTVACDLVDSFETGQSYVALSRCTSLEGLYLLRKISSKEIKVDPVVVSFYKNNVQSNSKMQYS